MFNLTAAELVEKLFAIDASQADETDILVCLMFLLAYKIYFTARHSDRGGSK